MLSNKIILPIILIIFAFIALSSFRSEAFRIPRPNTFSLPWDAQQMKQHNDAHEDLWNLSNGEFNFDTVTTTKSGANNGDMWLILSGSVARIQIKANGSTFTFTADGY